MMNFSYLIQTPGGTLERGQVTGSGLSEVRQRLARDGRKLVHLQPVATKATPVSLRWSHLFGQANRSLRAADAELTLQQLAVMIESGLELTASLQELCRHSPNRRQRKVCEELFKSVDRGLSFEEALRQSQAFPPVVSQLVRIGEATGELAVMLQRAAGFIQRRRQAKQALLSALAYPSLVAVASLGVAVYLIGWAIPKLSTFLDAMGRDLPAMTQSLLDLSAFAQQYGPALLGTALACSVGGVACYRYSPFRRRIDRMVLQIPIVGRLIQTTETEQLARSLTLMLQSGVFLPEALRATETLHSNRHLSSQLQLAREKLTRGNDLAGCMAGRGYAPLLASMVAVGERTGDLPRVLQHVADYYAEQLETQLKQFSRMIEPAIIVVAGGVVAYVYIAFFMALLSAGGNFQ